MSMSPSAGAPVTTPAMARAAVGAGVVLLATLALLPLRRWLAGAAPAWTGHRVLDVEVAYQALALLLTGAVVVGLRRLGAPGRFLAVGALATGAAPLPALGVRAGEPWRVVLRNFAVIAGGLTAVVVALQVAPGWATIAPHLPAALALSLPFAAANAAVEEGLLRVALLEATADALGARRAALLSGAMFGAVHYGGVPGGLPGVAMAGFLGYVLARSVLETRGALGAWLVHAVQDVVIFTLLFATAFARS